MTTASSWSALPQKPGMSADIVTNTGPDSDVRRKQTRPTTQNGQGVLKAQITLRPMSPVSIYSTEDLEGLQN